MSRGLHKKLIIIFIARPCGSVANWLAGKPNKSNLAYLKKFGLQNFENLFSIWLIEYLGLYEVFSLVWLILKTFI